MALKSKEIKLQSSLWKAGSSVNSSRSNFRAPEFNDARSWVNHARKRVLKCSQLDLSPRTVYRPARLLTIRS